MKNLIKDIMYKTKHTKKLYDELCDVHDNNLLYEFQQYKDKHVSSLANGVTAIYTFLNIIYLYADFKHMQVHNIKECTIPLTSVIMLILTRTIPFIIYVLYRIWTKYTKLKIKSKITLLPYIIELCVLFLGINSKLLVDYSIKYLGTICSHTFVGVMPAALALLITCFGANTLIEGVVLSILYFVQVYFFVMDFNIGSVHINHYVPNYLLQCPYCDRVYEYSFLANRVIVAIALLLIGIIPTLIAFRRMFVKLYLDEMTLNKSYKTDQLTKIYNRYAIKEHLVDERYFVEDCYLYIFDIDRFKKINDNLGHDIGDKTLIFLTKYVNKHKNKDDLFIRLGGDEFVLISKYSRAMIYLSNIINDKDNEYHINISFGYIYCQEGDIYEQRLKLADKKLYDIKEIHHRTN